MELSTTLPVGVGTAQAMQAIEALVKRFPEGRRIRVVVTEEPSAAPVNGVIPENPSLADFLQRLEDARRLLPPSPWQTAEDAMTALREGERD